MKTLQSLAIALFVSASIVIPVQAHDVESHYDRVHLSVDASSRLDNDTMIATVYAVEEGSHASELSNKVNKRIALALNLVKKYPQIIHQTNSYSSNPVYSNNKIKGWRVSQSLRLESQDMTLMSDVLGKLQADLALQSIQFSVSPDSKKVQDDKLIEQALESFQGRAKNIVSKMGRTNYKIVKINISTSNVASSRPQYRMQAMSIESTVSAPPISAGEQTISVRVDGQIELE